MTAILVIIVLCAFLGYAAWQYVMVPSLSKKTTANKDKFVLLLALGAAFIVRVICAFVYKGHETDISCFTAWADMVFTNGPGSFYSTETFTDYPPGYMYILWVVGALKHLLNLEGSGYIFVIKLPAIIADLVTGWLIYKIASKKLSNTASTMLTVLYIFNPAVVTDSSLWGQVDSVYVLFIVLMVWMIAEKKTELSYFFFAICILIKPQAFIYTPLVAYGIIEKYIYPKFDGQKLLKSIGIGLCAIAAMVIVVLPFGFTKVLYQYTQTLASYPYATINAFNIWGAIGFNWHELNTVISVIGYAVLVLIVAYTTYVFFKSKNESKYYFIAALLAFLTFMLSTKMHERYGFPVMVFLLLAVIEGRNAHSFALYLTVSLMQFFNIAWVLFLYQSDPGAYAYGTSMKLLSVVNVLLLVYMIFISQKLYVSDMISKLAIVPTRGKKSVPSAAGIFAGTSAAKNAKSAAYAPKAKKEFNIQNTRILPKIVKADVIIMAVIMVVYGAVALYDLGDMHAAETNALLPQGAVKINLNESTSVSSMKIYLGDTAISKDNPLNIMLSGQDDGSDARSTLVSSGKANSWVNVGVSADSVKNITLMSAGDEIPIKEVIISDKSGNPVTPSNSTAENIAELFDEQDASSPKTEFVLKSDIIELDKAEKVTAFKFFLGSRELNSSDRPLIITALDAGGNAVYSKSVVSGSVFYWNSEDINQNVERIALASISADLYINEIGLKAEDETYITPASTTGTDTENLFDEQDQITERATFRNSTYFDEIYHARTAYEFVHHLSVYEWTHPPLGKVFISLGILIFGMCPFGWRIIGTLFGIMMIPLIYIFAKKLLKKRAFAIIVCLLFTFDFMHFAQTRIATIDVYVTFFIILMYLFMFEYYNMSFYDSPLKKTFIPLALCGISMGLGIASKWTGIYAGAGLAVIFFISLIRRYREYLYAIAHPNGETNGIKHKYIIEHFSDYSAKTIGWCCIFFIVVPAAIYCMSYIPYLMCDGSEGFKTILNNQSSMLTYHGSTVLGSTHPFSSKWYEWIIIKRPIWYYSGTVSDTVKEGISSFGNPLVWWLGIPAFVCLVINAITKKDRISLFFVIAYLAQLIPWMPIERLTFIYHYFPCVPFITLMIGYTIKLIYDEAADASKRKVLIGAFVYTGMVIALFVMFYPVLSGQPCSVDYADRFLKWFDSWVLL